MSLGTILVIILILALIGGAGGWVGGPWYGGNPQYVGGGLGLVVLVLVVLLILGRI
jgi:hypothetical protein